jgi:predicted alpha-1,2-mannosidase
MKNFRKFVLVGAIWAMVLGLNAQNLTQFVNPFIGTDAHGHTYPGAQVPFGFMQLSPDTRLDGWDGCSAYHYSDSVIYGFSHTHLSGTGCSDYGDILLMPAVGVSSPVDYAFASAFDKKNEHAKAGFYSVILNRYNMLVELTATERCGMHRYHFPKKQKPSIFLDLEHRDEVLDSYLEIVNNKEIRGMRRSKAWATDQHVYFVIQFSEAFTNADIYNDDKSIGNTKFVNSKNIKARFDFKNTKKPILVKVGISGVDTTGARLNLDKEMPHWNFDQYRKNADDVWQKELSKIIVEGGTNEQMIVFYTALYHALLSPNIYNDVDGRYRGRDNKIYKTDGWNYYTVFSLWDTYRTLHPLLNIIDTERTLDFIRTMLAHYDQVGLLPMWELSANETDCMIGYHAVPVIYDAWIKGIQGFDIKKAFKAMKASAMQTRLGLVEMDKYGYIPSDKEHESVAKTLEYAYDDWVIAQTAKMLGHEDDYRYFIRRAQGWKHIFDKETGFMRPRFNGGWLSPFDPAEVNNHYTEANSWQYSFYVPQDMKSFIEMMGGKQAMEAKLVKMFETKTSPIGRHQVDITGLIGQYAHGNEPSHHVAYLFNFVGKPELTQHYVRRIMDEQYTEKPDGLCGNEDCGQMSAWLVMSALGFYPVTPGVDYYAIGSPWFKKATVNLPNGKQFIIDAPENSKTNIHIANAFLNGKEHPKSYFSHQEILNGGTFKFEMTASKGSKWGTGEGNIPMTEIKDFQILLSPIIQTASRTFNDSILVKIYTNGKEAVDFRYTLDGSTPSKTSILYKEPFYIKETCVIKAVSYSKEGEKSVITEAHFSKLPKNVFVTLAHTYDPQYTAGGPSGLVDGIRGTTNWRLGNWQGYQMSDFEAVVDYGVEIMATELGGSFLQDVKSWIWMPLNVKFYTSIDGKNFEYAGTVKAKREQNDYELTIDELNIKLNNPKKARYLKVVAKSIDDIPQWHPGFGDRGYIFVDEIWMKE